MKHAPWILSANGGGRTIDEAKADALLVADALEHPDSVIETGGMHVPWQGETKVMIQATTATMTCRALVITASDLGRPGLRRIVRMLRTAAAGVVDHDRLHASTREDAIRTLATSRMSEMIHDHVRVSVARPTPISKARATVIRGDFGSPIEDIRVRTPLRPGRIVLTSSPETTVDGRGCRFVDVVLTSETTTHEIIGVDPMDVLRLLRSA